METRATAAPEEGCQQRDRGTPCAESSGGLAFPIRFVFFVNTGAGQQLDANVIAGPDRVVHDACDRFTRTNLAAYPPHPSTSEKVWAGTRAPRIRIASCAPCVRRVSIQRLSTSTCRRFVMQHRKIV